MNAPDPKANTSTEAYLAYKAGYLEESELKPKLYEPDWHFDGWLAYWAGLTITYPNKGVGGKNLAYTGWAQDFVARIGTTVDAKLETVDGRSCVWWKANAGYGSYDTKYMLKTDFKENTQYTVSADIKPTGQFSLMCFEYTDGTMSGYLAGLTANTWQHITMTSTAGKTLKNIHAYYQDGSVDVDLDTFMVEEGSSASSYEPYYAIPEMLCDEEALVAYLSGVTDTYPEEIKDPYDVRITAYLKYLVSARFGRPDYPVNNEEFYLSTMDAPHTSNETPSADIELDTSAGKIISVEAYGDTFQQTYSGKNLWGGFASDYSINSRDVVFVNFADGSISANGTNNGVADSISLNSSNAINTGRVLELSAGDYTISGSKGDIELVAVVPNGAELATSSGGNSATFTLDSTTQVFIRALVRLNKSVSNVVVYPMLESGSTATSYEPYVGGIPSPNPDYPQDVQTVTGEQTVTTTGKNLVDWGTQAFTTYKQYSNILISAGTYTFSANVTSNDTQSTVSRVYFYNGGNLGGYISLTRGNRASATVTLATDVDRVIMYASADYSSSVGKNATYSNIQLEKGSTPTTYQAYTSQSLPISLTSKNLFDKDNPNTIEGYFNLDYPQITATTYPASIYIPCEPNTTYTVQRYESGLVHTVVGYTTEVPQIGTTVYGIQLHTQGVVTITTGNNAKYLVARIYHNNQDTLTFDEILATVQIEKNSQPTPYAPYYNYELCKIGDYQDYIYKSGDDWYVHKETGGATYDGSENWTVSTTFGRAQARKPNSNWVSWGYSPSTYASKGFSNYVKAGNTNDSGLDNIFNVGTTDIFVKATSAGTNVNAATWKAWLNTHNLTCYAILDEPTNTQITDATLVGQLEALAGADTYNEKTFIKVTANDPNLPALLKVEAYKY